MTRKTDSAQKRPVSLLDVVGFFADLAMFLPQNKEEVPPAFQELLAQNHVTQAGIDYIGRIDHKNVLSHIERVTLAKEGTYYLLSLQYFYVMQMYRKTVWQTNVEQDDPRFTTTADLFVFLSGRVEMCLRALGWPNDLAYGQHFRYLVENMRYRRKHTWEQAVRQGSMYPSMKKLIQHNMAKQIVMTDDKLAVIDKYSSKIHGVAAKFYRKLEKGYRYVGIRHFEDS